MENYRIYQKESCKVLNKSSNIDWTKEKGINQSDMHEKENK
jgi:hypothetical protein